MPRYRLDPAAPLGISVVTDNRAPHVTKTVPRSQTLNDLEDVRITGTPTDNQTLAYDTATSKWVPQTISGGAGGVNETNLTASRTATSVTVVSDTGTDALLAAADTTNAGVMTATDKTKLDGIEAGAQVNTVGTADIADFETTTELDARDTANRSRANHTGTQLAATISDFDTAAAAAAPLQSIVAGTNVTVDTTDPENPVINATGGGVGSSAWGGIIGTLSDQTDLQTELDAKLDATNGQTTLELTDPASAFGSSLKISDLGGAPYITIPQSLDVYANTADDALGMWNTWFRLNPTDAGFELNDKTNWGPSGKLLLRRDDTDPGSNAVELSSNNPSGLSVLLRTSNLTATRDVEFPDESGTLATEGYVDNAISAIPEAGDVFGPDTGAQANYLAVFSDSTGKLIKAGGVDSASTPTLQDDAWLRVPKLKAEVVAEATAAAGVTIDSVLLKDGQATLAADPTDDLQAATKQYVDNAVTSGTGDVTGPASSTDNAIARFDGTTGKLVQDSSVSISDSGAISGYNLTVSNNVVATSVITNSVTERTTDAGVTIDGVLIKDGLVDGRDVSVDGTKLDGIATGATANDTDANLKARANHTGTQTASTISDFNSAALSAAPAETTTTIGTLTNGATAKATPVDADMIPLMDSAASNVIKKLSWANLKATAKTYFDTLYQPLNATLTTWSGKAAPSGTVVGTSDTQTLSSKTFSDWMLLQGSASAPSTPASGYGKIAMAGSTTVAPKFINSSGTLQAIHVGNMTVDGAGWTVYDYGSWKEYAKVVTWTGSQSLTANAVFALPSISLPSGITRDDVVVQIWSTGNDRVFLFNERTVAGTDTDIIVEANNWHTSTFTLTSARVEVHLKEI